MLYINTFLDTIGEIIRGEKDIKAVRDVLNQDRIFEMFKRDCSEIMRLYKEGKVEREEIKRNLHLLKTYVVSQLSLHFEKVKELAKSKGVEIEAVLEPEIVNEIALYIDRFEKEV